MNASRGNQLMSGPRIQGLFGDRTAALGEHPSVRQVATPIVAGSAMWPTHTPAATIWTVKRPSPVIRRRSGRSASRSATRQPSVFGIAVGGEAFGDLRVRSSTVRASTTMLTPTRMAPTRCMPESVTL
ncbi:MAG: hypothetical protein QOC63_6314 [Mycobacterium sp.]|jgi:hypothetical protein|nr:hypothetical protein [Mycobacterium sp.]